MLDEETSKRIAFLRFPLIVAVIFIHAYGNIVYLAGNNVGINHPRPWVDFLEKLISQGLARVAVPIFFLISGYLFFIDFKPSLNSFIAKMKSRIRTLLVPFVFWNVLTFLINYMAQTLPFTKNYLHGHIAPIKAMSILTIMNCIFGFTAYPISYQFWFIRDLIALVAISPIIYFLNKYLSMLTILTLFILWFSCKWPIYIPSSDAFLFFFIGVYASKVQGGIFSMDKLGLIILPFYLSIIIYAAIMPITQMNACISRIGLVCGVITVLSLTQLLSDKNIIYLKLRALGPASFFVFASHEPILTMAKKIAYHLINPESSICILLIYMILPLLITVMLVIAYQKLHKHLPVIANFVSGGR